MSDLEIEDCIYTISFSEPFIVAYAEKTYTVTESEGYVEVCVNLTHSEMDILDVAIRVESYSNNQSSSESVLASESSVYCVIFYGLYHPFSPAPDSPDFLGEYPMAPLTDYEDQIRGINHIRNTVMNEMRRIICYNQTIYDNNRLEVSEYVGLTLAVRHSSVHTEVQPMYDQVDIQIVDNDSELHFGIHKQKQCTHITKTECIVVTYIHVHSVAVVGLNGTFYQVSENKSMIKVCATIYHPTIDCPIGFPFHVRLTTTNDSAGKERVKITDLCQRPLFLESTVDYHHVSTILEFDTCETRQCTEISIVDDMIVELTESFSVTLERIPGLDSRITLDPVYGEIEIIDDDGMYIIFLTWLLWKLMVAWDFLHRGCGGFGEYTLYYLREGEYGGGVYSCA